MRVSRTVLGGTAAVVLAALASVLVRLPNMVDEARACGGFFCQAVVINQAAEQIIFRQDGDQVTAVVLIQYVGDAEDFSWVVPVPGVPELSTGSDVLFQSLEPATRPQFNLRIEGAACSSFDLFQGLGFLGAPGESEGEDAADGVTVVSESVVGPFDVQVVSSEDPAAMAQWLEDNDYDLSDRGQELIEPYVEEGMNFVALKLRQDQGVGDIRPLIMKYQSDKPMIPIRLTAVAAEDDMGVLVWLLGEARAVPLNYLHVTVNYTLVNWYFGTATAYGSYQNLITTAMDEAGGQGFATDFAGRLPDLLDQLPSDEAYSTELERLQAIATNQSFYDELGLGFASQSVQILQMLRRELPLPEGVDEFTYQSGALLAEVFSDAELAAARADIETMIQSDIIEPLAETLIVFDGDPYMTRFFTTLSADEMTLDPVFSFNPDLGDQALQRNATLKIECSALAGTSWSLTLGEGTDRDGEVVLKGEGLPPTETFTAPVLDQLSVSKTEWLSERGTAELVLQNEFAVDNVIGDADGLCGAGAGSCGAVSLGMMLAGIVGLRTIRRFKRRR
ncbi:MAG: DUF2330 domain-containing protein [Planctomycetota bacterium]|nr:DUF2330 domain-containing protein [Planctomycetota bacterium]